MKDKIKDIITILEKTHEIQILYACESGSRAWGFDSKDSDWDIRFVYLRRKRDYLTVFPNEQLHIDHNNSEVCKNFLKYDLDFVGWDIKKVLYQFSKGNPDMISWFFSPIVYKYNENFTNTLRDLGNEFFKKKAAFYHYMHMAQKNYNQYIANPETNNIRIKKYLYVIRPILACMWIETYGTEPPMIVENIYNDRVINKSLCDMMVYIPIIELIAAKKAGIELGEGPRRPMLDGFCEGMMKHYKTIADITIVSEPDYNKLDDLFKHIVSLYN